MRAFDCLPKAVPVFDVTAKITDPRIEDIVKRILSKEYVTDYPHASGIFIVYPQSPQVGYGIDGFLYVCHLCDEVLERHACKMTH
jgi:hypothetical protein